MPFFYSKTVKIMAQAEFKIRIIKYCIEYGSNSFYNVFVLKAHFKSAEILEMLQKFRLF